MRKVEFPKFPRNNKLGGTRDQVGRVPGTDVALLSRPDAMPGPAWSLPAGTSCPYMVIGPNTICGSCYALKNRYTHPSIRDAQQARWDWTRECMRSQEGVDEFVHVLFRTIEHTRYLGFEYFRGHESGDFFSERYARAWIRICALTPTMHYWFPTRSWQAKWVGALVDLNALPNVVVRPSSLHFGDPAPVIPGLAAGTTVLHHGYNCPKYENGNTCGTGAKECRDCWLRPDLEKSYRSH